MASCLVPDFPAVMVALEHLKELEKELTEAGIAAAASPHLAEITAAVTELEAERRAAHEHLEVETIENSELRHQIQNLSDCMKKEIKADVEAVRASHDRAMRQLHEDLSTACRIKEEALERQQALLDQNETLYPERERVTAEHEELVAALNDKITQKYSLQMKLEQKLEQTKELKSCIAAVEQDKLALRRNMSLEKDAFALKKDLLSKEEDQIEEKIKQQKQSIRRRKKELEKAKTKKEETHGYLDELAIQMSRMESNMERLTASKLQCEKQLEAEVQKHQELEEQEEMLKKKPAELEEHFRLALQRLQEEIAAVEGKIEEGRATRRRLQETLAQTREICKCRLEEEEEVRAEHSHVSEKLERSRAQLEERVASIVRYSQETREMEKLIGELREADAIKKRMFERNQEELCDNVHAERNNISQLEEEQKQLSHLLEEEKKQQEEHVAKMKCDISDARRRYEELQQEQAALWQQEPKSENVDQLTSHIAQTEAEYKEIENMHHQVIQKCIAETQSILKGNEEMQKAVEEKEESLKEAEDKCNEAGTRYEALNALRHELEAKKAELELSIKELKEKTSALLQPRERRKAELEELQERHIAALDQQASELRAVQVRLYNNGVKLEQVRLENSRLQLAIRQMTDDMDKARRDRERYELETRQLVRDTEALVTSLQEAWREDSRITQEFQSSDGVLLESLGSLMEHLKRRREQAGNVSVQLHRHMLEFSRRLGDETMKSCTKCDQIQTEPGL